MFNEILVFMSREKSPTTTRRLPRARSRKTRACRAWFSAPKVVFHALANEARLCIVHELSEADEKCVCDLVGCCGLGWSTVSHHLSILRDAGIVTDEKRGQQIFYRLALPCVAEFIHCLQLLDSGTGSQVCCKRGVS